MKCPYCIKRCNKCGELLVANSRNFAKSKGGKWGLRSNCKICDKQYREECKEHYEEYRKRHKEEKKEYDKKYREDNNEHLKEVKKQYYQTEEGREVRRKKSKKYTHKKRILLKEKNQTYTYEQLDEMNLFFNNCCAYSGLPLDENNYSIDHIVPLSRGGDNLIYNLVPMYSNYNSSKFNHNMLDWYRKQTYFSEERLEKIIKWQEYALNKWGK